MVAELLVVAAAVLRLGPLQREQAGRAKSQFVGLPSQVPPSPSDLLPVHPDALSSGIPPDCGPLGCLGVLVIACSMLMVSHVSYPAGRAWASISKEMLSLAVAIVP